MYVFRKSFVGLLFIALAVTACSQVPKSELTEQPATLTSQFGTPDNDVGHATFVSRQTDAVYVIGGTSRSDFQSYESDAFLRRYKPDGTLAWRKIFNTATNERLNGLAEDAQGNIVVILVERDESGSGERTVQLLKYTSAGQELWRLPLVGIVGAFSVDAAPTGDLFVVGNDGSYRDLIRKYDRNGTLRWTKRFSQEEFSGISTATDSAGNLYVVTFDATVYKFDPTGKLVWKRAVPAGTADKVEINDVAIVRDSLLLVGSKIWVLKDTEYEYEDKSDVLVANYNLNGTQNWQRTFGTEENDSGKWIASDSGHNLYVAAHLSSATSPSGASFTVRKYTLAGRLLKQTTIAENVTGGVRDMTVYRNDEVYLTGETSRDLGAGYAGGYSDAFLMRVDGQGNQVWVR